MGSCHFQHGSWRKRDISTDLPGARGILSGSQTRESRKWKKNAEPCAGSMPGLLEEWRLLC